MEIHRRVGCLNVIGLRHLSGVNARAVRNRIRAALTSDVERIEIDFSQAGFLDVHGVGTLVSICDAASKLNPRGGALVALREPPPPVHRVLEQSGVNHLVEIIAAEHPRRTRRGAISA
jgi:anti-anti-sigma factor